MGVLGMTCVFGKQLLRLCAVMEALTQGGGDWEGLHGVFAGKDSAAHLHTVPETKPHQLKYSLETPRSRAVPASLISEVAGICYVEISR